MIPFQESDPPMVVDCMNRNCPPLDSYIYDQALERHVFLATLSGDFPGGKLALQSRNGNILWSHTDSFVGWNMP